MTAQAWLSALVFGLALPLTFALAADTDLPRVASFEDIRYPLAARLQHVQGVVVVKVEVDENGIVTSASALSGPRELVAECLANAKKWRFSPKMPGSLPIVYDFRIDGLCNHPCASHFVIHPPNLAVITIGEAVMDH